jgi:hypothetical protein
METLTNNFEKEQPRRGFIRMIAGGAAALGLTALASPLTTYAQQKPAGKPSTPKPARGEADLWFDKLKGSHRVVFDATVPKELLPFAWPKVFLLTNAATGTPEHDCGVVVVLRHDAICYAFKDNIWAKYNFAEVFEHSGDLGKGFQASDAATAAKTRNPFYMTKPGDFKVPGFGAVPIGITELQGSGVMFCVCNAAMTVFSSVLAEKMSMKQEDVMKEWKANLIPGIQIVPSGVWAVGRAQEHGCKYIFAG